MSGEGKTDKRVFTIRVAIETCRKAEAKFGRPEDESWRDSIIRALEEATRDYQLTSEDYIQIAREVEQNEMAREEKREKRGRRNA